MYNPFIWIFNKLSELADLEVFLHFISYFVIGKKKKKLVLKKKKKTSTKPDTIKEDETETFPSPTKPVVPGAIETKKTANQTKQPSNVPSTSKTAPGVLMFFCVLHIFDFLFLLLFHEIGSLDQDSALEVFLGRILVI